VIDTREPTAAAMSLSAFEHQLCGCLQVRPQRRRASFNPHYQLASAQPHAAKGETMKWDGIALLAYFAFAAAVAIYVLLAATM
jgi:hypothetical protein